jgi:hypothetical protein
LENSPFDFLIEKINKQLIIHFITSSPFSLGREAMFVFEKNETVFDWVPYTSVPEGYVMQIIEGIFYSRDGKDGLHIPEAVLVDGKWGEVAYSQTVGEQYKGLLPNRLDIRFFSFAENKFYQGSFDLPYEKILALFREGAKGSRYGKDVPGYDSIAVGMAPGGAVAVWVMGASGTHEVFFGQAEEYEGDLLKEKEDYLVTHIKGMPVHVQEQIKTNSLPIGIWAEYRTQYRFVPVFKIPLARNNYTIAFFNGETCDKEYPIKSLVKTEQSASPRLISYQYRLPHIGIPMILNIYFDFDEVSKVFQKLSLADEIIYLEIHPDPPQSIGHVRLYNSRAVIMLKKYRYDYNPYAQ